MKFSIIIPCFNVENYIENTIKSILDQTFREFEIIAIDDGSSDKTINILKKFSLIEKRLKIYSQRNQGVSFTRNKGIQLCTGDYIIFLDADDYIENTLLEKAMKIFKSNSEVQMFSFGYKVINKNNEKLYINEEKNNIIFSSKDFLRYFLKSEIRQSICSFIVKKELVNNLFFNDNLITGEDLDFQLRLLLRNNFYIYYQAFPYFHYLKRKNSATTTKIIPFKNLATLDCLNNLRVEMLNSEIEEFRLYHITRFFNIVRGLSENGFAKKDFPKIKNKLKKYDYILKDLKIEFNKKNILLNILKLLYKINFKVILWIFKINKIIKIKFN